MKPCPKYPCYFPPSILYWFQNQWSSHSHLSRRQYFQVWCLYECTLKSVYVPDQVWHRLLQTLSDLRLAVFIDVTIILDPPLSSTPSQYIDCSSPRMSSIFILWIQSWYSSELKSPSLPVLLSPFLKSFLPYLALFYFLTAYFSYDLMSSTNHTFPKPPLPITPIQLNLWHKSLF